MCVGIKARVSDVENGMAVIDNSGVRRKISSELIEDYEKIEQNEKLAQKVLEQS